MTSQNSIHSDEQLAAIYDRYFDLLVRIATSKFSVPGLEAEALAHDVLFSSLRASLHIADLRAWMVGAIGCASRDYWRRNSLLLAAQPVIGIERIDRSALRILGARSEQLAARAALQSLPQRCQELLRMRYFEGCAIEEIAERLGMTPNAARSVIADCLRRAEQLYSERRHRP